MITYSMAKDKTSNGMTRLTLLKNGDKIFNLIVPKAVSITAIEFIADRLSFRVRVFDDRVDIVSCYYGDILHGTIVYQDNSEVIRI